MASEYAHLKGYSAWLEAHPEPLLEQGALQHEYDDWLRKHAEWTAAKKARFFDRWQKRPKMAPAPERDAPDPLHDEPAAPFPVGVLPDELQRWVQAVSVFNQTPPSMAATFALMAAMVAAVDRDVQIHRNWREPTVGQFMLIASPSERKSPVFRSAFAPIYQWGRDEKKRAAAESANIQREIGELTVDADGNAIAIKHGTPEARALADLKQRLANVKDARRRIADDVTPEEFMRQMHENDGIMCLVSDEADVFQSFGGRYSNSEPKLAPLLKGWDGGHLMYDRVGGGGGKQRVNIAIDSPRAGIAIAGQYTVLDALKRNPVYREKGMLARLLYVVLPERRELRILTPPAIDVAVYAEYNDAIRRLFVKENDDPLVLANRLDFGNGWLMPQWLMNLRQRVEEGILDGGEFAAIRDWAGKLVSNMARIAAVLEAMGGGGEAELAELSAFFVAHAKRALHGPDSVSPSAGTAMDELQQMAEKLAKRHPPLPACAEQRTSVSKPFTVRDIRRSWYRLQSMPEPELMQRVERLVALGHLEELPNEDAGRLGNRQTARRFQLVVQIGAKTSAAAPEAIPVEMPPKPPSASPYDDLTEDWENDL